MLTFLDMVHEPTPEFSQAWALYEETFPMEERRSLGQQQALVQNPEYAFKAILREGEVVGLLGVWSFAEFTFLEHFAIKKHLRGQGLGKAAVTWLQQSSTVPIILEVEPPVTLSSQRRISFYEQLGFSLNSFAYHQPPYSTDKPWVPLQVMSFPALLSQEEFAQIKACLYLMVYQVEDQDRF